MVSILTLQIAHITIEVGFPAQGKKSIQKIFILQSTDKDPFVRPRFGSLLGIIKKEKKRQEMIRHF